MATGKVKITAPNGDFTGEIAGVGFAKGKGEVEGNETSLIDWFRRKGYGIGDEAAPKASKADDSTEGPEDPAATPAEDEGTLEAKTVKQLREIAKGAGITGTSGLTKADLVKVLRKNGVS